MSDETENDTLRLLRDAAAGFAKFDGSRLRALRSPAGTIDRARWTQIAEQGWLAVMVPEADDGLGLGISAAAVIAERLGYGCTTEPFVACGVIAPFVLGASEDSKFKADVLGKMLSGDTLATLAWQGETGSLAVDDVQVTASESGKTAVLNGAVRFVPAPAADVFLVLARRADGLAVYGIDKSAAGLEVKSEPLADGSASGWLRLTRVEAPAERLVLGPGKAAAIVSEAIDLALIAESAELVGNMERMLEMTLDYMRTRKQFGQAIGSFQALQHRAVDLWTHKELARHAVTAAVRAASAPGVTPKARGAAASSAKYRAAESALRLAKQCIQLHGAIGTTDEYDLGLYVNRAVTLGAWLGNALAHRTRYGAMATPREGVAAPA